MNARPGTSDGEELDVLTDLVEHYEEKHEPMGFPSAIAAIKFRMEQANLAARDLVPVIGSRAKVSEVLSRKRPLTMPMARALHASPEYSQKSKKLVTNFTNLTNDHEP